MSDIIKTYIFDSELVFSGTGSSTISAMTFNTSTGDLSLEFYTGATITENLDGRYSLLGHTHDISDITGYFDNYLTGATLNGNILYFNLTNNPSAFTANFSGLTVSGGATLEQDVTQNNHGFSLGNAVKLSGTTWVKAQANSVDNAGTIGVVTDIIDNNNFTYSFGGIITSGGPWSAGTDYFLSVDTAGAIIPEPTYSIGNIREFIGTGTDDGLLINIDVGKEIISTALEDNYVTGTTLIGNILYYDLTNNPSAFTTNFSGLIVTGTTSDDYTVSASLSGNTLEFTRLSGGTYSVDLSSLAVTGSTSDDYTTGATLNSTILEFTRLSGGTYSVDLSSLVLTGATNDDYTTGATFNTTNGIVTFTRLSGGTYNVDLDGRYLEVSAYTDNYVTGFTYNPLTNTLSIIRNNGLPDLTIQINEFNNLTVSNSLSASTISGDTIYSGGTDLTDIITNIANSFFGPVIFSAETSGTTSYVGYGTTTACKIRKVDTISGYTYTAYWSNGEELLDKIWANRYTYPYF